MAFTAICAQMESFWELREGSSEEATYAREWAEWLELKHAVLHGFMANAAPESVKLIREWEPGNSDLSFGYMEKHGNWWQLLQFSSKNKKVLDGATFGAYMIDTLRQRDFVFVFKDHTQNALFQRCH